MHRHAAFDIVALARVSQKGTFLLCWREHMRQTNQQTPWRHGPFPTPNWPVARHVSWILFEEVSSRRQRCSGKDSCSDRSNTKAINGGRRQPTHLEFMYDLGKLVAIDRVVSWPMTTQKSAPRIPVLRNVSKRKGGSPAREYTRVASTMVT